MDNISKFDFNNTPTSNKRPFFSYTLLNNNVMPCVSIITPFFNTNIVFHETAKSVFQQSFQQWEWIIVNDGSTDEEALTVLDRYRDLDPRIKIIDLPQNCGVSAARNRGIDHANTDFVVLLDSDDLLEPTAIEKWYWFLKIHSEWSMVGGFSNAFGGRTYRWKKGLQNNELNLDENLVDHTLMLRKKVWQEVSGFDESIKKGGEDWDFWLKCANAGFWGTSIPEYLHWYRTRKKQWDRWDNFQEENLKMLHDTLQKKYPRLWNGQFPKIVPREDNLFIPFQDIHSDINLLSGERKRLLLISPWLEEGGADKFNLDILHVFIENGWEITVVATLPSENKWLFEYEKITPDIFLLNNFLEPPFFPDFIFYLVKSRKFDCCLIANSQFGFDISPFLKKVFPQLKVISLCHTELDDGTTWGGYAKVIQEYDRYIDLNIVISNHLRDVMVEHGIDGEKIRVLYTGIDLSQYEKAGGELTNAEETNLKKDPNILFVGRLSKEKKPKLMLMVFKKLRDLGFSFKATIVGGGPYHSAINNWINEYGLSNIVRVVGSVPNEMVYPYYQQADIVFLPSEREGISVVLFEAMANMKPVVSSNVGGQCELVTEDVGFLIDRQENESDEVNLYVNALSKLILNPDLRKQMGETGYKRIQKEFNWEMFRSRLVDIINNLPEPCFLDIPASYVNSCLKKAVDEAFVVKQYFESIKKTKTSSLQDNNVENSQDISQEILKDFVAIDGLELEHASKLYRVIKKALMPVYKLSLRYDFYKVVDIKEKLKIVVNNIHVKFGI